MLCGIAKGLAEFVHRSIQPVVEVDKGVARPQPHSQLLTGDQLAGLANEDRKNFERLACEPDARAVFSDLMGMQVDDKSPKLRYWLSHLFLAI
jgi:hypothetical protein